VISFVASKGGPGKSTLATHCAVCAAQQGLNVLILDMDSQGSIRDWYDKRLQTVPTSTNSGHLSVRHIALSGLADAVSRAKATDIDILVIDTAGDDRLSAVSVVGISDQVFIPSRPTEKDLKGAAKTYRVVSRQHKPYAFILNQTPPRTPAKGGRVREAAQVLFALGPLAPVPIVTRVDYPDADGLGLGVTEYNPTGKAASDIAALWSWIENNQ